FEGPENKASRIIADRGVELVRGANHASAEHAEYTVADDRLLLTSPIGGVTKWSMGDKVGKSRTLLLYPKADFFDADGSVKMTLPTRGIDLFSMAPATNAPAAASATNSLEVTARLLTHSTNVSIFHDDVIAT